MKSVPFFLIAASLVLGGCSATAPKSNPAAAAPEKVSWNKEDVLGEFVCGTTVLIRHKKGLFLESGQELKQPEYSAKIITNEEGGYTTAYDYDEKNNTLSVTKSSRYYGVRPTVTVKCN
jgi:hypothetical protein